MSNVNWNNVKFRASSWGNLLTEPITKTAKEAGELSVTCQKELIKIYNQVKYGRKKDITTKPMIKGIECENEGIALYSRVEGEIFFKNDEPLESDWATGHPDLYKGEDIRNAEQVDDMKLSFEIDTFTPKLIEPLDKAYEAQLNVYFDLCNCQQGNIVYALVNAPESMVQEELYYLLRKMDVISEDNPEYKREAAKLVKQMMFDDIDEQERIIKIPVKRDDELIEKMKSKAPRMREWLYDFEKKHLSQYPRVEML